MMSHACACIQMTLLQGIIRVHVLRLQICPRLLLGDESGQRTISRCRSLGMPRTVKQQAESLMCTLGYKSPGKRATTAHAGVVQQRQ